MSINQNPLWYASLFVGAIGLVFVMLCPNAMAQIQPPLAPNPVGDEVRVHGKVIDPSGKPVGGAVVSVIGTAWDSETPRAQVQTNDVGAFEVSFRKSQFKDGQDDAWDYAVVAATAAGFAPGWDRWDRLDAEGNLVIRLAADDVPIDGRILDLEGRPVKGASIKPIYVDSDSRSLDSREIDGHGPLYFNGPPTPYLAGFIVNGGRPATTDAEGRFRLTGVGNHRVAALQIRGEGLAITQINVATRRQETESRAFQSYIEVRETIYGANFEFNIEPGRVVTGTVRDAETGKPMAGVTVEPPVWPKLTRTTTDANGRYRIEGIRRKGVGNITAKPNDDQCYFMCDAELADSTGGAPTTIDFALHRGVWITGRVTDAATGKPVSQASINCSPYLSNPYVQTLQEFHRPGTNLRRIPGDQSRYSTDANGVYRVVAAPGQSIVGVMSGGYYRSASGAEQIKCPSTRGGSFDTYEPRPSKNYPTAMKDIDVAQSAKDDIRLDFQLDPGITIHITLVDPQGKPVAGVAALGNRPGHGFEYVKSSDLDALAFRPDESRTLWLWYMPQKLGKFVSIKPSDVPSGKLTVTLEPIATIKGRLIGPDGLPITNARMQVAMDSPPGGTDSDGRFSLLALPGREYHLGGIKGHNEFDTDAAKIAIKPGEIKDLGDVHYKEYR